MRLAFILGVVVICLASGCGQNKKVEVETVPPQRCPSGVCPYNENQTGPLDHYLPPTKG